MNRLILIGNGFDLAHGLKTDYNSFIVDYFTKCLESATNNSKIYEDNLVKVTSTFDRFDFHIGTEIKNIADYVNFFYKKGFAELLANGQYLNILKSSVHANPFHITIKSDFLKKLILNCSNSNWVDIENEFYYDLKQLLEIDKNGRKSKLKSLNNDLKQIITQLEIYLEKNKAR